MLSTTEAAPTTEEIPPPVRSRALSVGQGWIACVLVLGVTAATLHWYGVSAADIATFYAYSAFAVTLPGTLLWRLMARRAGHIGVDAALGTAVGYAVEIPVYLLARTLDAPLAVLAWPALTLILFAALPSLRRHWRGSGERMPAGISWGAAAFMLYILAGAALNTFRYEPLSGPIAYAPYVDEPFQIALVGELKHHFPASMPYVTGTPLQYHWYVHAHAAAASWITGVDPQVLLQRLLPLPMMYVTVLLFVGIGRSLTGRWWPGLLGYGLASLATISSPFSWQPTPLQSGSIIGSAWHSPTQTFGAVLFAATVLALIELLRGTAAPGPGPWIAFALLAGAVAGAKATFIPVLTCALALALLVRLIATRRPGPALGALGITLVWLAFAQLGLYGGGNEGMVVAPLSILKSSPLGTLVLGITPQAANPWPTLTGLAVLALASWIPALAGSVGVLRRSLRTDPGYALILGIGLAGIGGLLLFGHPQHSQAYFIISGQPYLALLAACGLAMLVVGLERRRTAVIAAIAAACGLGTILLVQATAGATAEPAEPKGAKFPVTTLSTLARPYELLFAVLAALAVAIFIVVRLLRMHRRAALVAMTLLMLGVAVPAVIAGPRALEQVAAAGDLRDVRGTGYNDIIPAGGIEAARWLRAHSGPDDLVATNDHCLINVIHSCDSRAFWVSAYSERDVLLEGWSYTDRAMEELPLYGAGGGSAPYWDPALLAANDAVFTHPSTASLSAFAQQHHIRWLVAVAPTASPALAQFATLRFTSGRVSVYQLNG